MPFLTNVPLPQCLQRSSATRCLLARDHDRGCTRYLLEVKCLALSKHIFVIQTSTVSPLATAGGAARSQRRYPSEWLIPLSPTCYLVLERDRRDGAMTDFPRSLPEFERRFPDEAACAEWLLERRWGRGFACPGCGHGECWRLGRKVLTLQCKACRRETSVTAGTVVHRSHLPLKVWFTAAWLVVSTGCEASPV